MMETSQPSRAVYRPSGKVNWFKFLPALVVSSGAAMVMAWCLSWAFQKGLYLIAVAPMIASLVVVVVWLRALRWSHCRNRMVATVVSFMLALLLYLGYYHVGLVQLAGVQNAHRINVLPRYVQLRMQTDVARNVGDAIGGFSAERQPDRIGQALNWFCFGAEILLVIGVFVVLAPLFVSQAYCERCGRWMKSEALKLPPGAGELVWDALQGGRYADVHEHLARTSSHTTIGCAVEVEHCPACAAEERSQAAYLTVKDVCSPGTREPVAAKVISWITRKQVPALRTIVGRTGAATRRNRRARYELRPPEEQYRRPSGAVWRGPIGGTGNRTRPRRPYTGLEGPGCANREG